jgi:hypothetical protein
MRRSGEKRKLSLDQQFWIVTAMVSLLLIASVFLFMKWFG